MLGGVCEGDDSCRSWFSDSYGDRLNVGALKARGIARCSRDWQNTSRRRTALQKRNRGPTVADNSALGSSRGLPVVPGTSSRDIECCGILGWRETGCNAFVLRRGRRILNQHRNEIFLNYCPQCGKLARTPKTRQCRFCGHDWHDSDGSRDGR